ncbi:Uma2 family endonuclease [Thermostichus vulcanus]|uniref:Uma2 family endonuclease n=1 Tax=Thermostichus vulcanus str. 'Rupite' TaxID=2813851 RepID=A0ABT0C6Z4_THEVL|nr:Uma2 family endonuclease [Thermostichus vulcanus]MCJ2541562.1 Uma2 family endonuclease [Thermostichus vulcanus str. 'Rupite']
MTLSVDKFEVIEARWQTASWSDYEKLRDRGCLLEKQGIQAAAPDLILYVGGDIPIYREGERRYINLNCYRAPDLVGEVSDTTLASEMHQKGDLYAELGIREYWVIDIKGKRVFAFTMSESKTYVETEVSRVLDGLKIELLNQTLERLSTSNVAAGAWLNQQLSNKEDKV